MTFATVSFASSYQGANNTNTSHPLPSAISIAAGDRVYAAIASAQAVTFSAPNAGWTALVNNVAHPTSGSNTDPGTLWVGYKDIQGGDPEISASTITLTTNIGNRVVGQVWKAASGTYSGTPGISTVATGTNGSPNPSSLTSSGGSADVTWLALASWDRASGTSISAFPYASNNTSIIAGTSAATSVGIGICTSQTTASSQDPGSYTLSNSREWLAYTLDIRPTADISGTAAQTTGPGTQAASGAETLPGSAAQTTGPASQAATGAETLTGAGAQTAGPTSQAATGAETIGGSGAQTAGPASQTAAGSEVIEGSGAQTAGAATQAAAGEESVAGSAAQTTGAPTQGASGAEEVSGTAAQTIGPAIQAATGTQAGVDTNIGDGADITIGDPAAIATVGDPSPLTSTGEPSGVLTFATEANGALVARDPAGAVATAPEPSGAVALMDPFEDITLTDPSPRITVQETE